MRLLSYLLFLLALAVLSAKAHAGPGRFRAVDGDTIRDRGEAIRLKGFDTPESVPGQWRCIAERDHGKLAAKRLQELLDQGPVRIVRDLKRDKYGRVLGTLWIGHELVSDILIREGLEVAYTGRIKRTANHNWCLALS